MSAATSDEGGGSNFGLIIILVIILLLVGVPSILSMRGDEPTGRVEVTIPLTDVAMPSPPGCDEDGDCDFDWEAKGGVDDTGCINWIHVVLTLNGCKVAENEMVKIDTAKYEQTTDLAEAGRDKAWVSGIEVEKSHQGQGLGRSAWEAGDEVLKLVEKEPVHVFADQAGWGSRIMSAIDDVLILIEEEGLWAYLVK